jgi:exoribonuclease-2
MARTEHHRADLAAIARQAMLDRDLLPDFDPATRDQVAKLPGPASPAHEPVKDFTALLWCSIDNDDSRDLDQLSVGERLAGGAARILVAIADVDALVAEGTPADEHARHNTTSVYTDCCIFPMLPSGCPPTASLAAVRRWQRRHMTIRRVRWASSRSTAPRCATSQARYDSVAASARRARPLPDAAARAGRDDQLRLQDEVAQRSASGGTSAALTLETPEPRAAPTATR